MDFTSGWPQSKNEGKWKREKYQDLARELKNMEHKNNGETILISAVGIVKKVLLKWLGELEIRWRVETIQSTALESSRILRRVIKIWENLLSLKTKHDWVGKTIYWEMCKKLKFDHMNKRYIHKPTPVLENSTHKEKKRELEKFSTYYALTSRG